MAQAVLAARLPAVRALSAGTLALSGQPAHPRAIDVVRAARLGEGADLVLCMQEEHRSTILERMPFAVGRVRLLALDGGPIADPVYGEMAAFLDCLANRRHWIDEWIEPIAALTVVRPGRHR